MNKPKFDMFSSLRGYNAQPADFYIIMIAVALVCFDAFNYSTTQMSFEQILSEMKFFNISWSVWISIAFCLVDLFGMARMFTPVVDDSEPIWVWFLFIAWILSACFNAFMTWWGISSSIIDNVNNIHSPVSAEVLIGIVPVIIAIIVLVIRISIVITLATMLDHRIHVGTRPMQQQRMSQVPERQGMFATSVQHTNYNSQNPTNFQRPFNSNPALGGAKTKDDKYPRGD